MQMITLAALLATGGANSQNGVSAPIWIIVLAVVVIVGVGITVFARRRK